ncbi:MAG TPA: MEDS domain-containing protein [Vicinamibacterales bacterium]|nr:MEDS domain-containing protein [Vicinamibacterales bacterium]
MPKSARVDFHGVRFYESRQSMAATAAVFLAGGLIVDEAALVIGCSEHRTAVERSLRDISFSLVALVASQKLRVLDAGRTLREMMVNGIPDPVRFSTVIDREIRRLKLSSDGHVRVYDEMTDLLWTQGRRDAALRLEMLWDGRAVRERCSVLCGHSIEPRPDRLALKSLCACHSHIVAPDGAPHPINRVKVALVRSEPGTNGVIQ